MPKEYYQTIGAAADSVTKGAFQSLSPVDQQALIWCSYLIYRSQIHETLNHEQYVRAKGRPQHSSFPIAIFANPEATIQWLIGIPEYQRKDALRQMSYVPWGSIEHAFNTKALVTIQPTFITVDKNQLPKLAKPGQETVELIFLHVGSKVYEVLHRYAPMKFTLKIQEIIRDQGYQIAKTPWMTTEELGKLYRMDMHSAMQAADTFNVAEASRYMMHLPPIPDREKSRQYYRLQDVPILSPFRNPNAKAVSVQGIKDYALRYGKEYAEPRNQRKKTKYHTPF